MATTIAVVIEATTISGDVKTINVWDTVNTVSRFRVIIDNRAGKYNGLFHCNDEITISIAGCILFGGYIDTIHPTVTHDSDIFLQRITIEGRGYGREMVDLTVDSKYPNDVHTSYTADNIMKSMLTDAVSNIQYTPTGLAPNDVIQSRNEYLINNFRQLGEDVGYDFYVDKDWTMHFFPSGAMDSGVTLDTVANKNILAFDRDAENGLDIKNYVIVLGGPVKDHWTEFNAADWRVINYATGAVIGTATDDIANAQVGAGSIAIPATGNTYSTAVLDFVIPGGSLYGYSYLDFAALTTDTMSFKLLIPAGAGSISAMSIMMWDTNGDCIEATIPEDIIARLLQKVHWESASFPVGSGVNIARYLPLLTGAFPPNGWFYSIKWLGTLSDISTSFNWQIARIGINCTSSVGFNVDGLTMPGNIVAFATAQDATSQNAYGVRKITLSEKNVGSQVELQTVADRYLLQHKDVQTSLSIRAIGTAGLSGPLSNWKPGYNAAIYVPQEGVNSGGVGIPYRMVEIQHIFNTDQTVDGWDYYTELKLSPASDAFNVRRFEDQHSDVGIQRQLRDMLNYLQKIEEGPIDAYPTFPGAIGNYVPTGTTLWERLWEAEDPPVVPQTGASEVTDTDASNNYALKRTSAGGNGDMLILPFSVPGVNDYTCVFMLKVTSKVSTSTLCNLIIYNEADSATVSSVALKPSMFTTSGSYELFTFRVHLSNLKGYSFKITGFVGGITDLWCDWLAVTSDTTPYGITRLIDNYASDNDYAGSGSDVDSGQSGTDVDTAADSSSHNHSLSLNGPYYMINSVSTLYAASISGGSPTSAFYAPSSLDAAQYAPTAVQYGGVHAHGMSSPTHSHGVTSPSHGHGIGSPSHIHSVDEGTLGHTH